MTQPKPKLTVHDLAAYRLGSKNAELTPEEYVEAGFGINGSCEICDASLDPNTGYPSGPSGFWTCSDHNGDAFTSAAAAVKKLFG